jgi:ParB-like nuclease domain
MTTTSIAIDQILVESRMREMYGDLTSLKETMHQRGLLQAIGVQAVDGNKFRLLWGGRRLESAVQLGWKEIEAKVNVSMEDFEASELEFLENYERQSLTWQEEAMGLYRIHTQRVRKNALVGEKWGRRETGKLLGISHGNVQYTLRVAQLLVSGDSEIRGAPNMAEALRILLRRKELELNNGQVPPPPTNTFFKKEDLDELEQQKKSEPPPQEEGEKDVYVFHFQNKSESLEPGAGIIFGSEPLLNQPAWLLDNPYSIKMFPHLKELEGGIVFTDTSIKTGIPFTPVNTHLSFYYDPTAYFFHRDIRPVFQDNATIDRILFGQKALSMAFWTWFFHAVAGSFTCLFFGGPESIEGISVAMRKGYKVYGYITESQIEALKKEILKYGTFQINTESDI